MDAETQRGWAAALRYADRLGRLKGVLDSLEDGAYTIDTATARYHELRAQWDREDAQRSTNEQRKVAS